MSGGSRFFVDGYNVLLRSKLGAGGSLEERRAELLARIAATGLEAFVAFDSREALHGLAPSTPRRVTVAFAPPGSSADALLLERVRRAKDIGRIVVVSDDREVREGARFMGARTQSTAEFARHLKPAVAPAPQKERPLSRAEVDDWMKWFEQNPKKDE